MRRVPARALLLSCFVVFLCGALLQTAAVSGQESAPGMVRAENGEITINLREADIRAFISSVSDITGKNFVVDPRVKGNVTVISSAPTTASGLYDIFLSILKVHGFAAIPSGKVVKIVPDAIAKQEGGSGALARRNDELVTAVVPIKHVNAIEMVAVLRPLLPQEAHLAGFVASNTIVIADSGTNVQRLMRLIAEIDIPSDRSLDIVTLENASAEELVTTLNALTGPTPTTQAQGLTQSFVAYPRTNAIVIHAAPADMARYKALVRSLDGPDRGPDHVEVVQLRFASAADLVPVLQGVLSGQSGSAARADPNKPRTSTPSTGTSIQADEATNTLIIQAPVTDMRVLKEVIAQLDIRRAQVLVEGIIAELTTQRADEIGVQWQTSKTGTGVTAGARLPGVASGPIDGAVGDGGLELGTGLNIGYLRTGDLRVLLRALSSDRYTNVLSTPTLMTLDNAEAEIVVGQNVPFITGQFTNSTTSPDNPFQTIERKDVGILLRVKPQINEGDTVTLELEQEVSSVDTSTAGADLITNKRSIKTSVLVDDQDTVVLGGLIQKDLRENDQKIPILGDIPLLGQLFKNARSDITKTNLMVFLRPTIVRDQTGNRATAAQRYEVLQDRRDEAEVKRRNLLRQEAPSLPAIDGLIE